MKNLIFTLIMSVVFIAGMSAQEYKIITTVESIVPAGIGRSRIIENKSSLDSEEFTTERTDGKKSKQSKVKRKAAKVDRFAETKLLNFFSLGGINFQNIASNDALIGDKLNELSKAGWQIVFVTSGVESDGGETDNNGIFITRYILKRQ